MISGDSDDLDIDVSDDQYDVQSLDITNIPVTVTVNKVWLLLMCLLFVVDFM